MAKSHTQTQYYKREMEYLNNEGNIFAKKYPQLADSLQIDLNQYADPHLKRLIESFAFLTGRVQEKIDNQFEKIPYALLQILYPKLLNDTPPFAIIQFLLDNPIKLNGTILPKKTTLTTHTDSPKSSSITINTIYSVKISSAIITSATFEYGNQYNLSAQTLLKLQIINNNSDNLRLFINADYKTCMQIYKLLFDHTKQPIIYKKQPNDKIIPTNITLSPCGFDTEDELVDSAPYTDHRLDLVYDFIAFYQKFMFIELTGDHLIGDDITIFIPLANNIGVQDIHINEQTFLLNCTPVVNLFAQNAMPITLTHHTKQYKLSPKAKDLSIHSVDTITGYHALSNTYTQYASFIEQKNQQQYWSIAKENQSFLLSIYKKDIILDKKNPEILIPSVLYYNQHITNIKLHTQWSLNKSIAGLSSINIQKFTKPLESIDSSYYLTLLQMLHTHFLTHIITSCNQNFFQQILHLYNHLNKLHINIANYITSIEAVESAHYQRIGHLLCPIPEMQFTLALNSTEEHQTFLFGKIIGHTLKRFAPLHTYVSYKLTQD